MSPVCVVAQIRAKGADKWASLHKSLLSQVNIDATKHHPDRTQTIQHQKEAGRQIDTIFGL